MHTKKISLGFLWINAEKAWQTTYGKGATPVHNAEASAAYPVELVELCLFPGATDTTGSQSYPRNKHNLASWFLNQVRGLNWNTAHINEINYLEEYTRTQKALTSFLGNRL